jgi:hypothetical protein
MFKNVKVHVLAGLAAGPLLSLVAATDGILIDGVNA